MVSFLLGIFLRFPTYRVEENETDLGDFVYSRNAPLDPHRRRAIKAVCSDKRSDARR